MKKLYIIIILLFLSCSKDTIYEPIEEKCNCKIITYQVTISGHLVKQGETNILTKCENDKYAFDKIYAGNRLIQYKIYKCD